LHHELPGVLPITCLSLRSAAKHNGFSLHDFAVNSTGDDPGEFVVALLRRVAHVSEHANAQRDSDCKNQWFLHCQLPEVMRITCVSLRNGVKHNGFSLHDLAVNSTGDDPGEATFNSEGKTPSRFHCGPHRNPAQLSATHRNPNSPKTKILPFHQSM